METAVTIQDLNVTFGSFKALQTINLTLPKGQIIGFIGPSGAGKTTLLRTLVGRQRITSGTVNVFGLPAGSSELRSQISYMTQELSIYIDLSVAQNLRYFATMRGIPRKQINNLISTMLTTIDMQPQRNQISAKLSGGQKQRLSLAIALVGKPQLLVLDEPTVGLDPVLRDDIWQLFRQLTKQGISLIISSHVMDEAERCDDLILIRNGQVLSHDTPKQLCQKTNSRTVEESFLKLVRNQQ